MPDDEHPTARQPLGAAQYAGERLEVRRARVVDLVRELDPRVCAGALGEAARPDRARAELLAGGLVPGAAALAFAAGQVVDEPDAPPVEPRDDLVSEHRPRRSPGIFSTSDPQSPQASTSTSSPGPSGSDTSASAG